jgi:hypothetical protein
MAGIALVDTTLRVVTQGLEAGQPLTAIPLHIAVIAQSAAPVVVLANLLLRVADETVAALVVVFAELPFWHAGQEDTLSGGFVAYGPRLATWDLFRAFIKAGHRATMTGSLAAFQRNPTLALATIVVALTRLIREPTIGNTSGHELVADQSGTATGRLAWLTFRNALDTSAAAVVDAHKVVAAGNSVITRELRRNAYDLRTSTTAVNAGVIATAGDPFLAEVPLRHTHKQAAAAAPTGAAETVTAWDRGRAAWDMLFETGDRVFTDIAGIASAAATGQIGTRIPQRGAWKPARTIRANERQAAFVTSGTGFPKLVAGNEADVILIGAETFTAVGIQLAGQAVRHTGLRARPRRAAANARAGSDASQEQPEKIPPAVS